MENSKKKSNQPSKSIEEIHISELTKLGLSKLTKEFRELHTTIKGQKVDIEILRDENEALKKENAILKAKLANTPTENNNKYDKNAKGTEKIVFILRQALKAMTVEQFKEQFRRLEPSRVQAWQDRMSAIEKYVKKAVEYNRVVVNYIKGRGYYYALPEWYDSEGNLLGQYLPA